MLPESCEKRDIKSDPKRIALFDVKLLSRDKAIHIPYQIYSLVYLFI